MTRRAIAALGLILFLAMAKTVSALDLHGHPLPGGILYGIAEPGAKVTLDGEPVRVGADGFFVIGFGRDQKERAELDILHADGRRERIDLAIAPRRYETQRIDNLDPNMVEPDAAIAARIAAEQAKVAAARAESSDRRYFLSPFIRPTEGPISGIYGTQRILNGVPKAPHLGLDIAAPEGAPVIAPADGIVRLAEPDFYLTGGTLLIDHGFGIGSNFLHLRDIAVKVGQSVRAGEVIGHVGKTGRATGPHLHWGMTWNKVRLDPALFLPNPP